MGQGNLRDDFRHRHRRVEDGNDRTKTYLCISTPLVTSLLFCPAWVHPIHRRPPDENAVRYGLFPPPDAGPIRGPRPLECTSMARIGYARVSTTDQDNAVQIAALKAAGCGLIREERVSGTSMDGRHELATTLDFIRADDILTVPASTGSPDPSAPDHRRRLQGQGRRAGLRRAAGQHFDPCRKCLPRHARGLRRVRAFPPEGTAVPGLQIRQAVAC